ncbi:MAG: aminopeptidase P N-terminal domain-containing protein [Thermoanaerobaculia bacterium]
MNYLGRKKKLLSSLKEGVIFLWGRPSTLSLGGSEKFYQERKFLYLTGFEEPDSALIIKANSQKPYIFFCLPRNEEEEKWTGKRLGPEKAIQTLPVDLAYPIEKWQEVLYENLIGEKTFYYQWGVFPEQDFKVLQVLQKLKKEQRADKTPQKIIDSGSVINPLRLIKEKEEIEKIKKAIEITKVAYLDIFEKAKNLKWEYEVEAMLKYNYIKNGAQGESFPSIVASGVNATYLHYNKNNSKIKKGEFLLIDSGCLYQGYASDVTRTIFPEGKPTEKQRNIYFAVKEVLEEMITLSKPGISLYELNQICQRKVAEKLIELKILKKSLEEVLEKNLHKKYFPHRMGHWVGLDVHDADSYGMEDPKVKLKPGMVFTIEPGIYIPEDDKSPYRGIGVRLEEDILIKRDGSEVLTQEIPHIFY